MSNRNMNLIIEGLQDPNKVDRGSDGLVKGNKYRLKKDLYFCTVDFAKRKRMFKDSIYKKYTKDRDGKSWVVFPKGKQFKYLGSGLYNDTEWFEFEGHNLLFNPVVLLGDKYTDIFDIK